MASKARKDCQEVDIILFTQPFYHYSSLGKEPVEYLEQVFTENHIRGVGYKEGGWSVLATWEIMFFYILWYDAESVYICWAQ